MTTIVLTNIGKSIISGRIKGSSVNEPKYLALGIGGTGAVATQTAMNSELAEGRVAGTSSQVTSVSPGITNDTYQVTGTITATGTGTFPRAVIESGLFDASTAGNMFVAASFPVVNLASGDSLAATIQVTFS